MADEEEYELLPRHEIENLKKDLERLKKHPLGEIPEGENILEAINNLNTNIKKLVDLFTKTESDLASQYSDSNAIDNINIIKQQNEQIAHGIVAVADLVREIKEETKPLSQEPKIPIPQPNQNTSFPSEQGMLRQQPFMPQAPNQPQNN